MNEESVVGMVGLSRGRCLNRTMTVELINAFHWKKPSTGAMQRRLR
jgi:hypothetical protein